MKYNERSKRQTANQERLDFLRKFTLNKWSLTFAVILVMLSAYLALEEVDRQNQQQLVEDVLYVTDTLPYDVQKVNGGGSVEVIEPADNKPAQQPEQSDNKEQNGQNTAEQPTETDLPGVQDVNADNLENESSNYSINSDSDFFINYRLEREKARSRQLELLQALIDDEKTSSEMRSEAQAKVIAQADAIEQELMLESILVAKYGGEAVVFIQPEKVNVVLDLERETIADNEAEKIARLVDNYTGMGFENVIIVLKD